MLTLLTVNSITSLWKRTNLSTRYMCSKIRSLRRIKEFDGKESTFKEWNHQFMTQVCVANRMVKENTILTQAIRYPTDA